MKVVVNQRSSGIGDCLVSLVSAWRYARDTERTLVIDWRASCYLEDPLQNLFNSLFEDIDELAGVPVLTTPVLIPSDSWPPRKDLFAPRRWRRKRWLARRADYHDQAVALVRSARDLDEPAVYFTGCLPASPGPDTCRRVLEGLVPVQAIRDAVDAYKSEYLEGHAVVGAHIRHGNGGNVMAHAKHWQPAALPMERCIRLLNELRSELGNSARVFLCTDSVLVRDTMRNQVEGCIFRDKPFLAEGAGELHLNARETHHDALVEMLLLKEADLLMRFPPHSFFSWWPSLYTPESVNPSLLRQQQKPVD